MFLTCVIILFILFMVYESDRIYKGKEMVAKTNMLKSRENGYRDLLDRLETDAKDKFNDAVEKLESDLRPIADDTKFYMPRFNIFRHWETGEISTDELVEKIAKMEISKAVPNLLMRELSEWRGYAVNNGAAESYERAVNKIQTEVLPLYLKYIMQVEVYFKFLASMEKNHIKIVHGYKTKDTDVALKEMHINQAIKFIRSNAIDSFEKTLVNGYVILFEKKEAGVSVVTHWFLAPQPYRDLLVKVFAIKYHLKLDNDRLKWVKDIGVSGAQQ